MTVCAALFSGLPVLIWAGSQQQISLVLFIAIQYFTRWLIYIALKHQTYLQDLAAVRLRHLLFHAVCGLIWLMVGWAYVYIDPSIVTLIHETWPIFFMVACLSRYSRTLISKDQSVLESNSPERQTAFTFCMLITAAVGVALVVMSENGIVVWEWKTSTWFGLLLAFGAALISGLGSLHNMLMGIDQSPRVSYRNPLYVSHAGHFTAWLLTATVLFSGGLVADTEIYSSVSVSGVILAVSAGSLHLLGLLSFTAALHRAREVFQSQMAKINTIYYLTPCGSLALLVVFGATNITSFELLLVGVFIIVSVNILTYAIPARASQQTTKPPPTRCTLINVLAAP